jgi:protein disulfide-isomerase
MTRNEILSGLMVAVLSSALLTGCSPPTSNRVPASVIQPAPAGTNTATPVNAPAPVPDVNLAEIGLTEDGWFQSYEQAVAKAKESGKPILVDFTGSDWCGWCIKLDEEVFAKDEFKAWAEKKVVLLKLDFPHNTELPASLKKQNDELAQKHEIQGFPTILFLDAEGKKIGDYGYDEGGPEVWTKKADELIAG